MIFDTHAHYDDEAFDSDRDELIKSLFMNGIIGFVDVGANLESSKRAVKMAHEYDHAFASVGVHPDETGELNDENFNELYQLSLDEKVVAIGEIGLDYHWMVQTEEVQKYWFSRQLELARQAKKPVIIHSRDAAADTFDMAVKENIGDIGGIVHCYSYSLEQAKEYVKMGMYIGVGGVVTYKNGRKLKEVVSGIPLERIVLETDCPYLSPVPHRGERNSSLYIPEVVKVISELKGIPETEVETVTTKNALDVYRLNGSPYFSKSSLE